MSRPQASYARPAHVVTAFLWDGQRVLLAQRSQSVSTFPGHWAGISGYLEGDDPLEWALVEISEECGVDRTHLTVMGSGPTLDVNDESGEVAFRVHPFLFHIDDPSLVHHDWEAQKFEWIDTAALQAGQKQPTVPRLYDAFHAVWPPWPTGRAIERNRDIAVQWLRGDRREAPADLLELAAAEVLKLSHLAAGNDFAAYRGPLRDAVLALQDARPAMAAPANMLEDLLGDLQQVPGAVEFLAAVQRRITQASDTELQVARQLAQRLESGCRVMTISYSNTILRALQLAAPQLGRVLVCEGRPLLEGRRLAAALAKAGIDVTLLTDAQACERMTDVDCVVIGADAVLHDHDVVNKAGSSLLALAARYHQKPFYAAAASLKWERRPGSVAGNEENPSAEVWKNAPEGVALSNRYFDRVPKQLVSELIDENGSRPV